MATKRKGIAVFASTIALAAALTCGIANGSPGEIPGASLGDSVSAGAGSNVQKGQLAGDDSRIDPATYDKCHRGYDAWPALIDASPKYSIEEQVACGASTLPELYTGKFGEGSQFRALNAKLRFVTITDGANDIGFGPIVLCMLHPLEPCTEASEAITQARQKLAVLETEYTKVLFDIHAAAPNAAIIVVGYYELFPGGKAPGGDCLGLIQDPEAAIGSNLQQALRDVQIRSVDTLRTAGINARFVNPGIGQDTNACSDNPNGLVIGARTANPQRDGYHPSAGGNKVLFTEVTAAIDAALAN